MKTLDLIFKVFMALFVTVLLFYCLVLLFITLQIKSANAERCDQVCLESEFSEVGLDATGLFSNEVYCKCITRIPLEVK